MIEIDDWDVEKAKVQIAHGGRFGKKRVMEDVYIPTYRLYGDTQFPLAFFTYIAGSFGKNINDQLQSIKRPAGVNCSAMPVDILINLAQDYAAKGYDHNDLRAIFSVNREVQLADLKAT